jgi:AAHS family 4-hydroxybenzoate transporter-like MFS transporter
MNDSHDLSTIRVSDLVDGQKIGPFLISIGVAGFLCQIGDGYDLSAAAFAAIGISKEFGIAHHLMAPVFSASLLGMLFGSIGFGYIGDRFGRRVSIIICTLACGIFSLLTATAHNLETLIFFRFLTGVTLGGLPTSTIALMAEFSPARNRATLVTLMFMGITLGGSLPGQLGRIIPHAEWRLMFVIGGVAPLLACVMSYFMMPESLKFLALRDPKHPKLVQYARKIRHDMKIPDDATFQIARLKSSKDFKVRQLFEGKLKLITPLLWVMSVTNMMANFFTNSWMPTLLHAIGLSPHVAESTASLYYFGGVVGGVLMAIMIDRGRLWIVPLYMGLSAPMAIFLGMQSEEGMLKLAIFGVGVLVLGTQLGFSSLMGLCYPTQIRANGVGWSHGIGRFGAISGPMIGGALIQMHLTMPVMFFAPAMSLLIGCLATTWLSVVAAERFPRGRQPARSNVDAELST